MTIMDVTETHNEKAEKLNGRLAMLGVMAAIGCLRIHQGRSSLVSGDGIQIRT